jgi:hypothetical protein
MTPLRQRMIHDLTIRGLAENTQKAYLPAVTGLARYYRRSPISSPPRTFRPTWSGSIRSVA